MTRFDDLYFFFFKQKTAYEMRISDWSSEVCSSDLLDAQRFLDLPQLDPGDGIVAPQPRQHRARLFGPPDEAQPARAFGHDQREAEEQQREIGRASCREGVCQYV